MILLRCFIRLLYKIILRSELFCQTKIFIKSIYWIKWENFTELENKIGFYIYVHAMESVDIFEVFSFSCFRSRVLVERTSFLAIFTTTELGFHS